MLIDTPIKALLFANNSETQKSLSNTLGKDEITLDSISGIREALADLQKERYDIVLIDSLDGEAEAACEMIFGTTSVPVALLTGRDETNWDELQSWDFDGVVSVNASKKELITRIKAISIRGAVRKKRVRV